jgi:hypothetical protein
MTKELEMKFKRTSAATKAPTGPALMEKLYERAKTTSAAFPELSPLVIMPVHTWGAPLFATDEIAAKIAAQTENDPYTMWEETDKFASHVTDRGTAVQPNYDLGGTPVNLMALVTSRDGNDIFTDKGPYTKEMAATAVLDYAFGMLIAMNRNPGASRHYVQSFAEAYAAMRHIQTFDKDTGYIDIRREATTDAAVLKADTDHYTPEALKQAYMAASEIGNNFFDLPPHDTAEIAGEIARKTCLEEPKIKKIRYAYAPVAEYYEDACLHGKSPKDPAAKADKDAKTFETLCQKVFDVMAKRRDDADIFKAGQRFLTQPETQQFLAGLAKENTSWRKALIFINTHKPGPYKPHHAARSQKSPS